MRKVWLFLDDAAGFGPGCQVWCKAEESSVKIALTNLIFSWSCTTLLLERTPIGSDKSFPFLDPLDFEVMRELSKMQATDCFDQGFFCELMKHCTKICLVIFLLHFFVHLVFFACSTNFFLSWWHDASSRLLCQRRRFPDSTLHTVLKFTLHSHTVLQFTLHSSQCVTLLTSHFVTLHSWPSHCVTLKPAQSHRLLLHFTFLGSASLH